MPIPELQLETWSHQGSVTQSKNTYATIRNALLDIEAAYATQDFDVFLQGSYCNDTNIFAESDVDTVIQLKSIMRADLSGLPPEQKAAHRETYGDASYTYLEFKNGVIARLSGAFGYANVLAGPKAITVKANGSRRKADIIACYEYRRYIRFLSEEDYEYYPGIIFPTTSGDEIINFPKLHSTNCTTKHQETNSYFKPMVRIFKNMRKHVSANAPSYFIEGLLYNIPKEQFGTDYETTFVNCVNWLLEADRTKWTVANEQYWLLGDSNVQWPAANCTAFLNEIVKVWNEWE